MNSSGPLKSGQGCTSPCWTSDIMCLLLLRRLRWGNLGRRRMFLQTNRFSKWQPKSSNSSSIKIIRSSLTTRASVELRSTFLKSVATIRVYARILIQILSMESSAINRICVDAGPLLELTRWHFQRVKHSRQFSSGNLRTRTSYSWRGRPPFICSFRSLVKIRITTGSLNL